ncbi:transcriptional regulator [Mycoplana rhizolycopersici]|jgi:DNA-binding CsgD family transcriptional regulator|uniref:Transcriptional regulator n=1 Tax=Mycoplana rhizolycopersici TaxID=2746702 RepID=A0ABX2QG68_9HYPH|nr:transcriptional regulator [Rhizobium rhizolycopersici]NVP55638.1 transcriptional regulator [Rhizobium rhizolycopersici]
MSTADPRFARHRTLAPPDLSPIELRCLSLAAEGKTADQIVIETDLPLVRVSCALMQAIEKLGTRNITAAISRAALLRLI